jgi:hypothetical protein
MEAESLFDANGMTQEQVKLLTRICETLPDGTYPVYVPRGLPGGPVALPPYVPLYSTVYCGLIVIGLQTFPYPMAWAAFLLLWPSVLLAVGYRHIKKTRETNKATVIIKNKGYSILYANKEYIHAWMLCQQLAGYAEEHRLRLSVAYRYYNSSYGLPPG